MSSITSSPTLFDRPQAPDDFNSSNRYLHYLDTSDRIDFSNPPAPLLPPPYPEPLLFLEDDEDEDDNYDYDYDPNPLPGPRSRVSSSNRDDQDAPRASSPTNGSMRTRVSLPIRRTPAPGLQLLHTHIAHGAIHDAIVERFNPPACHPETHRAIIDDVMSWIQYIPHPSFKGGGESPASPAPTYTSATLSFYGPHTRSNRNRSTSKAVPPAQPEHIFWLVGPTGSGKSSLMHTIAERCSNTHMANLIVDDAPPLPFLAASFFFRHDRAPRNNKSKFVATLAYQLSRNVPGLGELIERVIEHDVGVLTLGEEGARGGRPSNGLALQMEKLVLEPLAHLAKLQQAHMTTHQRNAHPTPRVILIEALDECINDEDHLEVLNLVRRLSQDSRFVPHFRLVVSSKPHRTIERQFKLHPELDLVTYRLTLPFTAYSTGETRAGGSGRSRRRGGESAGEAEKDSETDIRLYLECKFNEMCRKWYGLPRNVGWPTPTDNEGGDKSELGVIDRLVYNTSGKFPYALTVIRFIMQGEGGDESSKLNPKRLLGLVLQAKFTKSYKNPLAALDALYTVIVNEAAERSGFREALRLARAVREIDELLSSGTGIELTLPRLALFFGFGAAGVGHSWEEATRLETAFVGGLMNAVLDVPVPAEEGGDVFSATFRRAHMKDSTTLRRVVRFYDKSFVDFMRDPSRSKALYVSRSQLYTDLAVRYLRSASVQYSLQPTGSKRNPSSKRKGKGLRSAGSSTSSFSATFETTNGHERHPRMPFSAPAHISTHRHNLPYQCLPSPPSRAYAIDADDASIFLSQLHLGKFCSFSVADAPELVKELVEFDVDLWLFGIAASIELESGSNDPTLSQPPLVLSLAAVRGDAMGAQHRRVISGVPSRNSIFASVGEGPENEREREKQRIEALLKLQGNSAGAATPGGPESDIDAMYRWVHVECSWSCCTPVCRKWRRAIVKFWQRHGAAQQPTVMDKIYDKFMPRDAKRVQLITSRYRL